jgi:hypothetical protein
LLWPFALFAVGEARAVEIDEVLAYLGIDAAAKRAILAGQIHSQRIQEGKEKTELAITVVAVFPSSLKSALDEVRSGEMFRADRNILDFHEITSWPGQPTDFAGIGFGAGEAAEVTRFLGFDGGSELNLSKAEIASFRALRSSHGDGSNAKVREAVAAAYRKALMARYRAYREKGLAGIAPYDRGGREVNPGRTLRLAASASDFFRKQEPALFKAFEQFPEAGSEDAEHRFYWIKQSVQDRPTLILSHRMLVERSGHAALAERQYYIGHSYNSVQVINGAFPVEQGLLVFYTNRTSIDQLAGMTGRVARPIASSRLIERVTARFEAIRKRGRR